MAPAQKNLMKVLLQIKPVNIPESVKEGLTRLHPLGEKLLAAAERESVFFRDVVPGRPTMMATALTCIQVALTGLGGLLKKKRET